jgi:1-acyl-sn-glycerol-3-phosphate acyltransferase
MLRTVYWFIYFFAYLIYSLPTLHKLKKLDDNLSVAEKDEIIYRLPKRWAKALVKVAGATVTVHGEKRIPDGAVLFVSNHQGNFDIPTLMGFIDKPKGFISKIEVKKLPIIPTWMEYLNCIFIDRKDRRQSIHAIKDGAEKLKNGHSIVIFPEGTRSKGGPIDKFKSGSFHLATKSGVPIVPIAINGTYNIMEANNSRIKPANVTINVLEPIYFNEYRELNANELSVLVQKRITEEVKDNEDKMLT